VKEAFEAGGTEKEAGPLGRRPGPGQVQARSRPGPGQVQARGWRQEAGPASDTARSNGPYESCRGKLYSRLQFIGEQ